MVGASELPPELISLVHHVELNKAGWWDKAVDQLIVAAIWLSGESLTPQGVLDDLRESFSVDLDAEKTRGRIDALCVSGILVPLQGEQFKISERSLNEFEKGLEECQRIQEGAHRRFVEAMRDCCPPLDAETTWASFNDEFLLPLIREIGARTYELLSGRRTELAATPRLEQFFQRYPDDIRRPLRTAVITFLDPKDPNIRSYILRQLNAYFFVEAGNLSAETVDALTRIGDKAPSFTVFVDTNFLFSILGLHENPSNEAAQLLMDLVSRLSEKVAVKLYVLPVTVDEARGVFEAGEQSLRGLRLTPNLVDAAVTSGLSGLSQKFAEESKKAGHALRAEDYFGPYIRDLSTIARAKGVEFFNQKLDTYRTNQEVVDALAAQLEFEKRFGTRAKSYEQLEHDMVLWYFVRDRRPARIESPLEAGYWIVTVDFRFLGFDRYKRESSASTVPICVHPATLIHMLQFWVPRTQEFEEAVLGNLRLPFLFQEFDPNAEKVTIRILGALARFEKVGDLPREAVGSILLNDALRQRLQVEGDLEKHVELVREALIEDSQRIRAELKAAEAKAQDLKQRGDQQIEAIRESERQLEEERAYRKDLEKRLKEVEAGLRSKEEQEQARAQITDFAAKWVIAPLVVILASGLGISIPVVSLTPWGSLRSALMAAGVWSVSLILWVWLVDWRGSKDPFVTRWRPFGFFQAFKARLFAALGVVVLAVFASALWELMRSL